MDMLKFISALESEYTTKDIVELIKRSKDIVAWKESAVTESDRKQADIALDILVNDIPKIIEVKNVKAKIAGSILRFLLKEVYKPCTQL